MYGKLYPKGKTFSKLIFFTLILYVSNSNNVGQMFSNPKKMKHKYEEIWL